MTGQHTGHTPIRGNGRAPGEPERVLPLGAGATTVASLLKQRGYATGGFGKWGIGGPGSESDALAPPVPLEPSVASANQLVGTAALHVSRPEEATVPSREHDALVVYDASSDEVTTSVRLMPESSTRVLPRASNSCAATTTSARSW